MELQGGTGSLQIAGTVVAEYTLQSFLCVVLLSDTRKPRAEGEMLRCNLNCRSESHANLRRNRQAEDEMHIVFECNADKHTLWVQ